MNDMSAVRWGLVGFGAGGRVFHAPLLAAAAGVELAAVVTGDPDRREQAVSLLPGVTVVPDLAALVELGVEAITVTTPPGTHTSLAMQALDLGLDVVVDKPFALTAAAARTLVDAAATGGRMVTAYQNRRWDSDFLTIRRLLAGGELGTVHTFVSRIDRFRAAAAGWSTSVDPALGGGTLLDLGPHLIDQAVQLFGPVVRVHAALRTVRAGAGAEDDIELHLDHGSGVRSTIAAGMASAAAGPRFQVSGTAGGYLVNGFDCQEAQLKVGGSPASLGESWGVEDESAYGTLTTSAGSRSVVSERGRWDTFYPAAAAAVRRSAPPPVDPMDAVATAIVIDAARMSAAELRVVEIG